MYKKHLISYNRIELRGGDGNRLCYARWAVSTFVNDNHCETKPSVDCQLLQCDFADRKPIDKVYEETLKRRILRSRTVHVYVCATKKGKKNRIVVNGERNEHRAIGRL